MDICASATSDAAVPGMAQETELLRQFVECSPVPVAMFDRQMRYLVVSRQYLTQYGLEDRTVIGQCHYDVFPEIMEHWKEAHQRGLAGEAVGNQEDAFPRPDGHVDWVRWEIRPWHHGDGEVGGIILYSEFITEHTEQAHRLQESETSLRAMVEKSPLPTLVTRFEDGRLLHINGKAMELFALSGNKVSNQFLTDFYMSPDERCGIAERLGHDGHIDSYELHMKKGDGTPVWVNAATQVITFRGERAWMTVLQDITERKFADEMLGEVERMARFGTYRFDLVKGTWESSEALDATLGIDADYPRDLDGWLNLVHPEDRAYMRECIERRVLEEQESFDREYRIVRANDGVECWVHGQGSLKCDVNGRPYLLFGSIQDISEYKQTSAWIGMFRQAIDQAGEAIMITDRHGDIVYVNSAFSRYTGYGEGEILGQNPRILNGGKQDKAFYRKMWETILSGNTWQGRVIDKRKDGSLYPCLLSISALHNPAGEITHFIGIQQDLEEYEELEKQFYQSQKMEALGILVGGIAHDFNNTLAGITGNLYLARKQAGASSRLMGRLKEVEALAFRAAGMIQQLLAFSRKGTVEMRPLSLAPFLSEAVKLHRMSLSEDIEIMSDIRDKGLVVCGDANLLQQVLMNLINNARDAVQDAFQPRIAITLDRFQPDDAFLRRYPGMTGLEFAHMRISDNGTGIPPEHIEHIFEPFFTTKDQDKGTGLGLAMVYGAVHSHGGMIMADSPDGQGTRFDLYLPLSKDTIGDGAPKDEGDVQHGQGEMILVADDDRGVLDMTREVLERLGYQVITAYDGLMAVDIYRKHRREIRLLIMDMVMPKLDGPGAYRIIQNLDPAVKVLFATGYDMGGSRGRMTDIGEDQVIAKPFSIGELSRRVQHLLSGPLLAPG